MHPGQRRRQLTVQTVIGMLLPHPRKVFVLVTSDDRVPPLWLAKMIQWTTCGLAITLRVPEQRCVPSCRFSAIEPLKKLPEDRLPLTTTCSRRVSAVRRCVREIRTIDRLAFEQFIEMSSRPLSPCTRAASLRCCIHQATLDHLQLSLLGNVPPRARRRHY